MPMSIIREERAAGEDARFRLPAVDEEGSDRHPNASPREHFLRLALITLGPELASGAYPEISSRHLR